VKHTKMVLDRRERRRAAAGDTGESGSVDLAARTEDLTGVGIVAGHHLGHTAQPRRRKKGR
jgi:preprotein translocase subunit SecF